MILKYKDSEKKGRVERLLYTIYLNLQLGTRLQLNCSKMWLCSVNTTLVLQMKRDVRKKKCSRSSPHREGSWQRGGSGVGGRISLGRLYSREFSRQTCNITRASTACNQPDRLFPKVLTYLTWADYFYTVCKRKYRASTTITLQTHAPTSASR